MSNTKIPKGYQGTYANNADGSATLIMVSRSTDIADNKTKKEQIMGSQKNTPTPTPTPTEQQGTPYVPYTTEQKKEYAKQFTPSEIRSYRKGQQNAYAHMGNIGRRNSFFIHDNMNKTEATPPVPSADKPKSNKKKNQ